jgi:uncharacterized membrane protein
MTAHFPSLIQYPYHVNIWPLTFLAWFHTPIIQIYDRSLSWLGSYTPIIQIYDRSLSWVGTIPLSCKYMTAHFPSLIQYPYHVNIWPLTFLAWYNTPIMWGIVPSQESELSYIYMIVVLYQARKVSCHIFIW